MGSGEVWGVGAGVGTGVGWGFGEAAGRGLGAGVAAGDGCGVGTGEAPGVAAGVEAGVAAGVGVAIGRGLGVGSGSAVEVGVGCAPGPGSPDWPGVPGGSAACEGPGVGVGTTAVIGFEASGDDEGSNVGLDDCPAVPVGVAVGARLEPGSGDGTTATGPGAAEGVAGGSPMVPMPNATPARTRLTIPRATTRRARWAAVTAMKALLCGVPSGAPGRSNGSIPNATRTGQNDPGLTLRSTRSRGV